jgi:hypothetical protein
MAQKVLFVNDDNDDDDDDHHHDNRRTANFGTKILISGLQTTKRNANSYILIQDVWHCLDEYLTY